MEYNRFSADDGPSCPGLAGRWQPAIDHHHYHQRHTPTTTTYHHVYVCYLSMSSSEPLRWPSLRVAPSGFGGHALRHSGFGVWPASAPSATSSSTACKETRRNPQKTGCTAGLDIASFCRQLQPCPTFRGDVVRKNVSNRQPQLAQLALAAARAPSGVRPSFARASSLARRATRSRRT